MSTLLGHFEQVAWEEGSDTVWRTTEAGMEEEDKEVFQNGLDTVGLGHLHTSKFHQVCFNYAHHGHCPEGNSCSKSHSIDGILKA